MERNVFFHLSEFSISGREKRSFLIPYFMTIDRANDRFLMSYAWE